MKLRYFYPVFLTGLLAPIFARAASIKDNLNAAIIGTGIGGDANIYQFIGGIIKVILGMLGVALVVLIIYGGFIWMTSLGEAQKIEKAKNIIKSSIIGVVIILSSYVITNFVFTDLLK